MKQFNKGVNASRLALLVLMVIMALPLTALGQGRGWGHGRERNWDQFSKKCGKFVNCHDARDGRWDGHGPRRERLHSHYYNRNRRVFRNNLIPYQRSRRYQRY